MTGGKSKTELHQVTKVLRLRKLKDGKTYAKAKHANMVLYLRLDGRDKRGQSLFRGQISLSLSLPPLPLLILSVVLQDHTYPLPSSI